ncbi:MAG: flagellar motor protein MotB [Candidatus Wallbacteria bacterium]|nr:flagellar motor protein MotB [Candidatus Wallbacteria bacterium]
MIRKKGPEKSVNQDRWLITYADMVTLLVIFFIIMYSMSKVDRKKFDQMAESLRFNVFSAGEGGKNPVLPYSGKKLMELRNGKSEGTTFLEGTREMNFLVTTRELEAKNRQLALEYKQIQTIKGSLEQLLTGEVNALGVQLQVEERGLVVRLSSNIFFELGSSDLKPDGIAELSKIAGTIKDNNFQIMVEGHTDSLPINTSKFPSNWELSGARALNVLKFLMQNGPIPPERLAAIGYGEFHPLDPGDKSQNRPRDRRVDIVLIPPSKG